MGVTRKISLDHPDIRKRAVYNNGELAIIDNLHELELEDVFNEDIHVFTLCLRGKASIYMNGQTYRVQENDLFICLPNIIVENALLSVDFQCYCLCLSSKYVQRIAPMTNKVWDIKMFFKETPLLPLNAEEASLFCQYYELIRSKITTSRNVHLSEVIDALLLAFIYEFQDAMNDLIQAAPNSFSSAETLFRMFIDRLAASYPKKRSVAYYAEQLHVTPKYLSSVCKEAGGESPSKLIDQYMIKDIESLMKRTQKTIKEIANELEFTDISFFGKYVRRHFGVSPKVLREQLTL